MPSNSPNKVNCESRPGKSKRSHAKSGIAHQNVRDPRTDSQSGSGEHLSSDELEECSVHIIADNDSEETRLVGEEGSQPSSTSDNGGSVEAQSTASTSDEGSLKSRIADILTYPAGELKERYPFRIILLKTAITAAYTFGPLGWFKLLDPGFSMLKGCFMAGVVVGVVFLKHLAAYLLLESPDSWNDAFFLLNWILTLGFYIPGFFQLLIWTGMILKWLFRSPASA